jgi:nucleotide-binding universal stress UspA family protein
VADARFRRLLVPVDGSPEAEAAVPLAIAVGRLYASEVVLLHVGPDPAAPMAVPYVVLPPVPSQAELAAVAEPARARVAAAGLPVHVRTRYAHPAAAILDSIAEEDIDLVVLATHGRSGVSRWLYGSVTEKVVRHAMRPVLVCRASAPAPAGGEGEA